MRTNQYMTEGLSDGTASCPEWDGNGRSYRTDDRVRYAGITYRVIKDHKSQPGCIPEGTADFFEAED